MYIQSMYVHVQYDIMYVRLMHSGKSRPPLLEILFTHIQTYIYTKKKKHDIIYDTRIVYESSVSRPALSL